MRGTLLATAAVALAVGGLATSRVVAASNGVPPGHIGICHHTGLSPTHEWIFISPAADGVLNGHGKLSHNFDEDVIPPFVLVGPQGTASYPGHNLDERIGVNLEPDPNGPYTGAEILAAGCVAPTATGTTIRTTTTPGSTSTVTVTTHSTASSPRRSSCTAVGVRPRQLVVGRRTLVTLTVTRRGRKVAGVRVRIRGPHFYAVTKRSNRAGVIRRYLLLERAGIVRFAPVAARSCGAKLVGVTGVVTPPVTG